MNLTFVKADIKNFCKNTRYRLKYGFRHAHKINVLYFVFEPQKKHPGLADRLKAVISMYNLAKANGYAFKLYFETPFKLSDYLKPKFDWELSLEELEYSIFDTKIISETNWRKFVNLKPDCQYHCYRYSGNELPRRFEDSGYRWFDLFHEMFEPSDELNRAYNSLGISAKPYIAIHLRFVNALEKFESTYFDNHLRTQVERDNLICRCIKGIIKIMENNKGMDVYVFSDSKVFLNSLKDLPVKTLDSSSIGHVSETEIREQHLKTFLDLYVMSKSDCVYRIVAPELFNHSYYAVLAATIGDVECIDVNV